MATLSSFFGGGGGGATSEYYPLTTKLKLYPAYRTTSGVNSFHQVTRAGNPLNNGYSILGNSTSSVVFYSDTGANLGNVTNTSIHSSASFIGGAIYLSSGNVLLFASNGSNPGTLYIREFDYSTATAVSAAVTIILTNNAGFGGQIYRNSAIIAADGNYTLISGSAIFKINSSTLSLISEEYGGHPGGQGLVASNGFILSHTNNSATTGAGDITYVENTVVSKPETATGNRGYYFRVSNSTDKTVYSPFFQPRSTVSTGFAYVGYPGGKVWSAFSGMMIDIADFDALMQEFENTYVL